MHPSRLAVSFVAMSVLVLGGCGSTREQQGNVIGAIAGGVLGSQVGGGSGRVAATIAGTLIGGYIGGNIGRQMDDGDRYRAGQALESTPTNESSSWRNPDTGSSYSVTPTRTYYDESRPCREYTTEAWIDGRRETVYGRACRQADGSWLASN
ncbi:MAG: glycine zipper 2TM domain-containing protein [Gammaproteobacteria bacterium]|nr:glycine zipper 2TM domain-containing protein [Gammaproteobacteria bacterium]MCB1924984.1 glycine zipper 2TM domain-containing protein [Gammaproteobacteria bacterium]